MKEIICATKLSYYYGEHLALENVSFSVREGEFICIVGPNGGGKSTLLKLILGLLSPQGGELTVLGERPGKNPHLLAYLPQDVQVDPLFPISVEEVVLMGCLGHGAWYSKSDRERASAAMKKMDVYDLRDRSFNALSGGQRQRVLLARALTCYPQILLLDEPTLKIDQKTESELLVLLKDLRKEMAIVMVSHDYHFVTSLAQRVFCVEKGLVEHPLGDFSQERFLHLMGGRFKWVEHHHGGG